MSVSFSTKKSQTQLGDANIDVVDIIVIVCYFVGIMVVGIWVGRFCVYKFV
jgi:hypothetical protein